MPLLLEDTAPQPSTSFWNRFLKNKDNKNSFITFRDNDLQMNMSYGYDTPFGYYFYPVPQTYEKLKGYKNFEAAIPFAGDRPLIVWADLDRSFSNKILRIDKEGNSQFSDEQIVELGKRAWDIHLTDIKYDKNKYTENYIKALEILIGKYVSEKTPNEYVINNQISQVKLLFSKIKQREENSPIINQELYDILVGMCNNILKSDDKESMIINYQVEYAYSYPTKRGLYQSFLSDTLANRIPTRTNSFWYFTYKLCNNSKKWTRLLYKLGFVGVVDEGSETIHRNEPYQAVFFVSAALGGLTVYKNPKDAQILHFTQDDIKKKEPLILKNGLNDYTLEKFIQTHCYFSFISYDKSTNSISGNVDLDQFYRKNNINTELSRKIPIFFKDLIIKGDFICASIGITSLMNFPRQIIGDCDVRDNPITTLAGSPDYIENNFYCSETKIKDTNGICGNIGGSIYLHRSLNLTNIDHIHNFGGRIHLNECHNVNLDRLDRDILLRIRISSWDDRYAEYIDLLRINGFDQNLQPLKKESFKLTSKKFKDYLLREEVFNRGQLDLEAAWEVYQKQYQKSTGNTFTKELFFDRARNWTFYGNIEGWVAVRYQASGYVKLVAVAGSMKGKFYGMNELLQTNPPLWGAVTSDIADMLKKKGFVVPNYFTIKLLMANVPPAVFGGKKVDVNLDGSVNIDYDGIGTTKKWFVCNKAYIQKFVSENNNIPAIAKSAIAAFL